MGVIIGVAIVAACTGAALGLLGTRQHSQRSAHAAQSKNFDVLHTANQVAPFLRRGISQESLDRALPYLRAMSGTASLAFVGSDGLVSFDGTASHHEGGVHDLAMNALATGRTDAVAVDCGFDDCPIKHALSVPIASGDRIVGALIGFDASGDPSLIRTLSALAGWISGQLELAKLDAQSQQLARAELRALRAQISPHFIYNALTAIASFSRSDPDRARQLILEFADFIRYSLHSYGEFTTIAEELRCTERYLTIERARFGDRLTVNLEVAPEVLPVALPFLVIQPLVENAVRHGIEGRNANGRVDIVAKELSSECVITIEDNGVGADPDDVRGYLNGDQSNGEHIGLRNVDERLRSTFGPSYGLVIDTGVNAGTKVTLRIPKYRPGVRAATDLRGRDAMSGAGL